MKTWIETETPPLLSMADVCHLTTLSRTAINKARKAGRFPQAVNLDGSRLAFVTAEVLAWIENRVGDRPAGTYTPLGREAAP